MDKAAHPERFEPSGAEGTLIDTEHRARYWWAARLVAGRDVLDVACGTGYGLQILADAGAKSVTGVDLEAEAVSAATARAGGLGRVLEGDLRALPLEDDSVDVVVCFETIEHIERAEEAIAEIRRVLRPEGLAVVSSPNPGVYPEGNEHHVREFAPQELADALGARFAHTAVHRQYAGLASLVEPDTGDGTAGETRATTSVARGEQTYSIVLASDTELPAPEALLVLGSFAEVDWFREELEAHRELATARGAELDEAARHHATTAARIQALEEQLFAASKRVLEVEQQLAMLPLVEHRLELALHENGALWARVDHAEQRLTDVQASQAYAVARRLQRARRMVPGKR